MTEIKTKIPAEMEPAAVGGMVADAKYIIDRVKNKNQTEVNAATDASINQLSNEIDAVNTQDIVPVDSLPAVGSADPRKIYRVVGETSYTDNMVNAAGDGWKELAVYTFPGIDDEPTAGSDNLVKSGGVKKEINRNNIIGNGLAESDLDIIDDSGNILATFKEGDIKTKNFDSKTTPEISNVSVCDLVIKDNDDNALVEFSNGHIKTKNFNSALLPANDVGGIEHYSNVLGFNRAPDMLSEEYDYILILAYGQSYTVATDGQYAVTNELDDSLYIFGTTNSTTCTSLTKLKDSSAAEIENTINSAADIIAKITRKYTSKFPEYIINNQGLGSRTVLELMKESSIRELLTPEEWAEFSQSQYYENRYSRITTFLTNLKTWATTNNKKILCPFFIYLQGESDTHVGVSGHGSISCCGGDYATYKERLTVMLNDLKEDIMDATGQSVAPAALIDNIGNGQFNDTLSGISQAQTDLTVELDGVYSCGPYYAYPSYGAHPTPDGRRWIGEALAKTFYNTFIGCRNSSMRIIDYVIDGNSIILDVMSPCPPLVVDGYTSENQVNYGFKAFDANLDEISIISVSVSSSQVILTFNAMPEADFYISYGTSGYGNIRDSSNWNAKYKYESNALGNMQSIAHYPKDKDGNAIIGRYYPMWNWLPFGFISVNV